MGWPPPVGQCASAHCKPWSGPWQLYLPLKSLSSVSHNLVILRLIVYHIRRYLIFVTNFLPAFLLYSTVYEFFSSMHFATLYFLYSFFLCSMLILLWTRITRFKQYLFYLNILILFQVSQALMRSLPVQPSHGSPRSPTLQDPSVTDFTNPHESERAGSTDRRFSFRWDSCREIWLNMTYSVLSLEQGLLPQLTVPLRYS